MNGLQIIDLLCEITTIQADLIREMATEIEHNNQMSSAVKNYYRDKIQDLDSKLDITEYHCRRIMPLCDAEKETMEMQTKGEP